MLNLILLIGKMTKLDEYNKNQDTIKELKYKNEELAQELLKDESIWPGVRINVLYEHGKDSPYIHRPTRPALYKFIDEKISYHDRYQTLDYLNVIEEDFLYVIRELYFGNEYDEDDCDELKDWKIKLPSQRSYKLSKETYSRYENMIYRELLKDGIRSFIVDW